MPNINPNRSSSSTPSTSNIPNDNNYNMILDESDSILNDLNDIIDSQINVKLKKRGENSFKIKPIPTATNSLVNFNLKDLNTKKTNDFELKMPKFKSYLIKSSLSSHMNTVGDDSSPKNDFKNGCGYGQHATTISGGKLITASKKSTSNQGGGGKSSVKSQASANDVSSSSTCIINNAKKKRSSLFNLFSFKK